MTEFNDIPGQMYNVARWKIELQGWVFVALKQSCWVLRAALPQIAVVGDQVVAGVAPRKEDSFVLVASSAFLILVFEVEASA